MQRHSLSQGLAYPRSLLIKQPVINMSSFSSLTLPARVQTRHLCGCRMSQETCGWGAQADEVQGMRLRGSNKPLKLLEAACA